MQSGAEARKNRIIIPPPYGGGMETRYEKYQKN